MHGTNMKIGLTESVEYPVPHRKHAARKLQTQISLSYLRIVLNPYTKSVQLLNLTADDTYSGYCICKVDPLFIVMDVKRVLREARTEFENGYY